jgi:hypothetical protein
VNQIHRQSADAATVRPCTEADMPAVAAMFQRNFRSERHPAPAELTAYLRALFLENPDHDPDLASRVFADADGTISGFIGILPARMTIHGRPIRAAIAGSFMVDRPDENPLAGARLLRAFFAGPQDLSISESANPVSQAMWERLGAKVAGQYSLEWLRVLRPAGFAVAIAAERVAAARFGAGLGRAIDAIAGRLNPLALDDGRAQGARGVDADNDAIAGTLPEFASGYALAPDWSAEQLAWRLDHANLKDRHGGQVRRLVRGRGGAPVGCYVYYGRPGGIAWVLQVLANGKDFGPVVDDLLRHVLERGCVAVRGKICPGLGEALLTRRCLYFHRSSTVYRSADPEVVAALKGGDALVTGLAGESWTRLIGHAFR